MRGIIVCTKVVPKSEDLTFDQETMTLKREGAENQLNEADKNAIEFAVKVRERYGGKVTLLSMGPMLFEPLLKLGIAMGADDAVLLSAREFAGGDSFATSMVLAAGIRKIGDYDLVVLGEESSDGGTGQVPSQVAELLDLPQILYVSKADLGEGKITATRSVRGGHEVAEGSLPALVSVELGVNQPRFPDFRRKRWAETEFKLTVWNASDLGLNPEEIGLKGSYTSVLRLTEFPTPERRREFVEGTDEEKAARIAEILKAQQ